MNTRGKGTLGEQQACEYVIGRGMRILERNFSCRGGEIDIIARDGAYIVFIEVKSRENDRYGYGAEAVNYTKRRRIAHAAKVYLYARGLTDWDVRFDVIVIRNGDTEYIENAFDMTDI